MKRTVKSYKEEIIQKYKAGISCNQIAKDYKCSGANILKILREAGIERRASSYHLQKYDINKNYFAKIDSEEKAYFLGFIYADGCNYTKRNNVCITQKIGEIEFMSRLNALIQPDKPLLYISRKTEKLPRKNSEDRCGISIINSTISQDLLKLGVVSNKSLVLTFPTLDQVPEHFLNHFIRGYFDGDGCICIYKSGIAFTMVGTEMFLSVCQNHLCSILGISKTKLAIPPRAKEFKTSTRVLSYGGLKNMLKIREFLYKDATIYLQRKYDKFSLI